MISPSPVFPQVYLLGGLTGSGKTELLNHLYNAGQQVLNLEELCGHDGSAFAPLQYFSQPSSYRFHKELNRRCKNFDTGRPVFIEQELRKIGNLTLPGWLFDRMMASPVIWLDTEKLIRVQRLSNLIRRSDPVIFCNCLQKLSDRMGEEAIEKMVEYFACGDIDQTVELLLEYYDNSEGYAYQEERILFRMAIGKLEMGTCCKKLIDRLAMPVAKII